VLPVTLSASLLTVNTAVTLSNPDHGVGVFSGRTSPDGQDVVCLGVGAVFSASCLVPAGTALPSSNIFFQMSGANPGDFTLTVSNPTLILSNEGSPASPLPIGLNTPHSGAVRDTSNYQATVTPGQLYRVTVSQTQGKVLFGGFNGGPNGLGFGIAEDSASLTRSALVQASTTPLLMFAQSSVAGGIPITLTIADASFPTAEGSTGTPVLLGNAPFVQQGTVDATCSYYVVPAVPGTPYVVAIAETDNSLVSVSVSETSFGNCGNSNATFSYHLATSNQLFIRVSGSPPGAHYNLSVSF
jgi:hypothetical protein